MSNNWAHLPLHSTEPRRKAAQGKGSALLHQGQKRDVLAVKQKFKKQDNYFFFFLKENIGEAKIQWVVSPIAGDISERG